MLSLCLAAAIVPKIEWEPYTLTAGQESATGELGRLRVPENRAKGSDKKIEIAFVRLKSTAAKPGYPIVYLDGGPGSSAINLARSEAYFAAFKKFLEHGDVILLDQRGIGRSKPALVAASAIPIPDDFYRTKDGMLNLWRARIKEAWAIFEKQGVDIHAFNTEQSADDVDDLRAALGVDKINLVGFSYGTHLALSCIRRHGAHLAGAVMIGTEGPGDTVKPPLEADREIEKLDALIKKDPAWAPKIPDFKALVKRVFDKLEANPAKVTIDTGSRTREMLVGRDGLRHLICRDLGDTNDHPWFPLGFYTADQGDYTLIQRLAQRRYQQYAMGTPLLSMVNDTASGSSPDRAKLVEEQAKVSIFGNAMNYFDELTDALGKPDLGEAYRAPIHTSVRSLFISGTLDWNTPPEQADAVRKTFKGSTHIVVEHGGHESQLVHPSIQQAIVDFLAGKDVSGFKLDIGPPKFVPPPAGWPIRA